MSVGRKEEGRAVLLSVQAGRGVVLAAPPGYGKTALLRELLPALEAWAPVVWADRVAPLRDLPQEPLPGPEDPGGGPWR
jgi:ATPase subunit of ABC transporter with duplicated ATPase domains